MNRNLDKIAKVSKVVKKFEILEEKKFYKICGAVAIQQLEGSLYNRAAMKEAMLGMKKIPTLFKREFGEDGRIVKVLPKVTPGCEWVLDGEGEATEKVDGACCAIIGGELYRRYDAKGGKTPPEGAIPCTHAPDPVTGHWPHWVKVNPYSRDDGRFRDAYYNTPWCRSDGTYECVGPRVQRNPYGLDDVFLERHGRIKIKDCPRTYEGIREYLRAHEIEGIVWHRGNGEMCKIKRRDFGFEWPVKYKGKE